MSRDRHHDDPTVSTLLAYANVSAGAASRSRVPRRTEGPRATGWCTSSRSGSAPTSRSPSGISVSRPSLATGRSSPRSRRLSLELVVTTQASRSPRTRPTSSENHRIRGFARRARVLLAAVAQRAAAAFARNFSRSGSAEGATSAAGFYYYDPAPDGRRAAKPRARASRRVGIAYR